MLEVAAALEALEDRVLAAQAAREAPSETKTCTCRGFYRRLWINGQATLSMQVPEPVGAEVAEAIR